MLCWASLRSAQPTKPTSRAVATDLLLASRIKMMAVVAWPQGVLASSPRS